MIIEALKDVIVSWFVVFSFARFPEQQTGEKMSRVAREEGERKATQESEKARRKCTYVHVRPEIGQLVRERREEQEGG